MTIPKALEFAVFGAGGMLAKALVDTELDNFKDLKVVLTQARANMLAVQSHIAAGNGPNVTKEQRSEIIRNAAILAAASGEQISREIVKLAFPLPAALRSAVGDAQTALAEVFKVATDALPSFIFVQVLAAIAAAVIGWKLFVAKGK